MIKSTVLYLRKKGLCVDGVGWQGHVDGGWATDENLDRLRNLMDWSFANNLSFNLTEAPVWMDSTNVNSTQESHAQTSLLYGAKKNRRDDSVIDEYLVSNLERLKLIAGIHHFYEGKCLHCVRHRAFFKLPKNIIIFEMEQAMKG